MNYEADILSSISSIAQLETLSKDNWKVYFKNLYCLENDKNTNKDNMFLNQFFTVCEDHEINKEEKQLQDITILLMFNTQVIIVKK